MQQRCTLAALLYDSDIQSVGHPVRPCHIMAVTEIDVKDNGMCTKKKSVSTVCGRAGSYPCQPSLHLQPSKLAALPLNQPW